MATKYEIINRDGDFYIVQTDGFDTDKIVAKINTTSESIAVVKRDGRWIDRFINVGNLSLRLEDGEDNNWISIDNAPAVKVTWAQAMGFLSSRVESLHFSSLKAFGERKRAKDL